VKSIKTLITCLTCLLALPTLALTEKEQQLVTNIDQMLPQSLKHLENIVNINSGTMNFSGVKQVAQYLQQEFDAIGFNTQWLDGKAFDRAGHLLASYGTQGKKVLLIGHLDTVFTKADTFQAYQNIDGQYVAGPGITDMKGGNIIMLTIAKALKEQGVLENISLKIVLTGDEEKSGRPLSASKKALIDAAKWADLALGFEDGDGNIKTAVISRRGAISWNLAVTAKSAHSSQIFAEGIGDGAIFELSRILNDFRQELAQEPNLTFNPGLVVAGTRSELQAETSQGQAFGKSNVIAKQAFAKGDIRAISPAQLAKAKQVMRKIVARNLPHTQAEIQFDEGYPPMAPTKNNQKLLNWYSQASLDLGYGKVIAVNPRKAGAADISFTANYVDMALDGLGVMGTGGHTKNEVADISSLAKNSHKAALLIYRLSQ